MKLREDKIVTVLILFNVRFLSGMRTNSGHSRTRDH